jgi:hypothetical protein
VLDAVVVVPVSSGGVLLFAAWMMTVRVLVEVRPALSVTT